MERRKQQRPPPGPKKDYSRASLTPLNDSRTNILMQIQDERFFKWPKTPKGPSGSDQTKYCQYHRCLGHSTENYRTLQQEIEDLIRRGHLKRFVKGSGQEPAPSDGEPSEPPRARTAAGVVHMISSADTVNARHGPPEIASSSKRAKLGVRNDVISFSSEDMAHVTSPHTDPLVVSALVSAGGDDYQLKRVFIDNGSSQNLL